MDPTSPIAVSNLLCLWTVDNEIEPDSLFINISTSSCHLDRFHPATAPLLSLIHQINPSRNSAAYRKCQGDDIRCGPAPEGRPAGSGSGGRSDICVPKEKKCDGYMDCRSGKDEEGCSGVACHLDQFRCANGQRCLDAAQKCDHKNDCGDNSDEQGCSKLEEGEY